MTRVTGVPLAGAALLLAGAVTAAAQRADLTAVRRAIDGQNAAWAAAVKQGDAAALARIFADSGVQVGMRVGKIWKGRSAIEQRFRADFADGRRADEVVVQSDEVLLDGALAKASNNASQRGARNLRGTHPSLLRPAGRHR